MSTTRLLAYIIVALTVLVVVAVVLTVALAAAAPSQAFLGFHHTGFGYLLMAIWMVVFWAAVIGGVILLIYWLSGQRRPAAVGAPEDPMEVLKRRYARGEITREQFEQMRHDLEGKGK